MTSWPPENTVSTPEQPYYCDGKYLDDDPLRVSPEGNAYGQSRRFAYWPAPYWWDGSDWRLLEAEGQAASESLLPGGPRPFGEVWRSLYMVDPDGTERWIYHYWDSEADCFKDIVWYQDFAKLSDLPRPGWRVGQAHMVIERHVQAFWTGEHWARNPHSGLEDDEPQKHLPDGFLKWVTADVRITWVSPAELTLEPMSGGSGQVWVNSEYVVAGHGCSVFNTLPVLEWDSQEQALNPTYLDPSNEYWVYLANSQSYEYFISALPGDETHAATPEWDFRGKLFLSRSADINGYLSDTGPGQNARLVGRCETDSDGEFAHELNISLISRTTSFAETYRDYSDYRLEFVDYNRITLKLLDGMHGMIYVGGSLEYLGADYDITLDSVAVVWDDDSPTKVSLPEVP